MGPLKPALRRPWPATTPCNNRSSHHVQPQFLDPQVGVCHPDRPLIVSKLVDHILTSITPRRTTQKVSGLPQSGHMDRTHFAKTKASKRKKKKFQKRKVKAKKKPSSLSSNAVSNCDAVTNSTRIRISVLHGFRSCRDISLCNDGSMKCTPCLNLKNGSRGWGQDYSWLEMEFSQRLDNRKKGNLDHRLDQHYPVALQLRLQWSAWVRLVMGQLNARAISCVQGHSPIAQAPLEG